MFAAETETVKLGPNQSPPQQDDLIAEIKREKTGGWTAKIVSGMLYKEKVDGSFNSLDEAVAAAAKFVSRSPRKRTLYYRIASNGRRIIKKTRYVRSF